MNIPEWAKWVARDEGGRLYAFENRPTKDAFQRCWIFDGNYVKARETDDSFAFVKWENDGPTPIKVAPMPEGWNERMKQAKAHGYDEVPTMQIDRYTKHQELIDELHATYVSKNKDYGNSFGESHEEFGIIAGVVRIGDKYNRLKTLAKGHDPLVKDESIKDTLKDMANYCLMLAIELEGKE